MFSCRLRLLFFSSKWVTTTLLCGLLLFLEPLYPLSYTVQKGDTLYHIASTHGTSVDLLKSSNNLVSNDVHIGQRLTLPGAAPLATLPAQGYALHVIVPKETYYSIAKKFGITVSELLELNSLSEAKVLHVGEKLKVPRQGQGSQAQQPAPDHQDAARSLFSQVSLGSSLGVAPTAATSNVATKPPFWPISGARKLVGGRVPGMEIFSKIASAPVQSVVSGKVSWVGHFHDSSQMVIVEKNNLLYIYGGLSQPSVSYGQAVAAGDTLGVLPSKSPKLFFSVFQSETGKILDLSSAPRG